MQETPDAHFHLDHPPMGVAVPAGVVVLRGWAAGRAGVPLVDIRLTTTGGTISAIHGFPRADLAQFFKLRDPFFPGGFEATLTVAAGHHEIVFEGLSIAGEWRILTTVKLTAEGESGAVPAPAPAPVVQPHEFARALQCTLRRAATQPVAEAAAATAAELPNPAALRYPHQPFHGHLHQPALLERVLFGRLRLAGWLFHETATIRRVVATTDLQVWQDLRRGGDVPYVTAQFPQFSAARDCAVGGLIDVPAQLPMPLCIRVYAELANGTWHLCQVQRTSVWDQEQEKAPFAAFSRVTFARAVLALRRACRERGLAVPLERALADGVRGVYEEYRTRALPETTGAAPAAPAPADLTEAPPPRHVVLVTHNLSYEGAPLFLLELARSFMRSGTALHVVSARPGPLESVFQRLRATVQVVDTEPLLRAKSAADLTAALDTLAGEVSLAETELVIANTISSYWGVHLASRAGRPSLFYIHESTTPASFYLGHMAPDTLPLIESTFRLATHVSFLTESTRVYYRPWLGPANHGILPGWIDVTRIDQFLNFHPRVQVRRELGLAADTRVVINVGSVCDRKGQHIFARAVDLLWREAPALAASCRFLMIGGHNTLFDRDLADTLAQLDRANLRIIPATDEPLHYYAAADLFVCSSYEESFPRVIMEAMASRLPILSTSVHGIADLLVSGEHARLVPPGNSRALADGLRQALEHPADGQTMAARARARVVAGYSADNLLPQHVALAGALARPVAGL
jgi:glycosyltransferase involved in cell wall biosynthesis